jgi:hypothetical protein
MTDTNTPSPSPQPSELAVYIAEAVLAAADDEPHRHEEQPEYYARVIDAAGLSLVLEENQKLRDELANRPAGPGEDK